MPPLRSDRASRACETCRRLKTRCYPSKYGRDRCLRCETQDQDCSLKSSSRENHRVGNDNSHAEIVSSRTVISESRLEERLAKLESLVHTVVDRLDVLTRPSSVPSESTDTSLEDNPSTPSTDELDAPMFLIKDAAKDVYVGQPNGSDAPDEDSDPISTGVIELGDAYELLSLFRTYYGRWVNFDETDPVEQLMLRVRTSPLLFHSICLVAARHTRHQRINDLAPTFFRQAKRLLQASLLSTPQSLEFFQAALLLSLWSTTIGQIPLSIDSWLLTSYALQQGLASSMATSMKGLPADSNRLRASCTWNHICLTHLQYCVATGRKCLLQESQIERCADVLDFELPQFEVRMVAELKLYWAMVNHCCAPSVNLPVVRTVLSNWMKEWSFLFNQPRSQFLEMSYNFAVLLAHCRSLRSHANRLSRSKLDEMAQHARDIISLAQAHTDERTPHLTDHIYHIITFSAITLCQLAVKYPNLLPDPDGAVSLRNIILGLVGWLRSIGSASHISRVLANIIEARYRKSTAQETLRSSQPTEQSAAVDTSVPELSNNISTSAVLLPTTQTDAAIDYPFQDFAWTSFFDLDADNMSWPQSNELVGTNYTPTNETWSVSAHGVSP